jgi:predicted nucleotidyltransferase
MEPNPIDYLIVQDRLEEVESGQPFEVIFYGSRERGDSQPDSDFNFYLLAHTQDQMKPGFIQKVTSALNTLEKIAPVNLVAGDLDSFRLRMNLFEPSVIHMLELGTVFYGDQIIHDLQKEWEKTKEKSIPIDRLVPFLSRRIRFYKNLKPRSEKEDAIRMERIMTLSIQVWVLQNIPDLSTTELIHLDIPIRSEQMIPSLYRSEMDEEISRFLGKRKEAREIKKLLQAGNNFPEAFLENLQTRIVQLKRGIIQETEYGGT